MYAKEVAIRIALQDRMFWIGKLLRRSSTSERPSGRIESRLNKSLPPNVIRGLERETLIDTSRLDLLVSPTDNEEVFSVPQRAKTFLWPQMRNEIYRQGHVICELEKLFHDFFIFLRMICDIN
jgi:hypothetical protein